ncbi:MAG: C40 family peptidase [Bacteroidales bacterium]|nr:C40 family peptidase [Bacteroidales bacterium]
MKNNIHKTLITILIIGIITQLSGCSGEPNGNGNGNRKTDQEIIGVVDSLKGVYAPDSRVAIIDIETFLKKNSITIKGESDIPEFKAALFSALHDIGYSTVDSLTALPHPSLGEKHWALITLSVANLRGQAGHSKELVTQALMGTPVKIMKKKGSWYQIQTPDQYLAWTEESALFMIGKGELDEWNRREKVIISHDYTIIRESPDLKSHAVSDIVLGGIVRKASQKGDFTEVILPDGRSGFLPSDYCLDFKIWTETVLPEPKKFIDVGFEMLGRPYVWGGTSSKGMDCSGFVKTLYFTGGLILPRDASQQVFQGELVDTKENFSKLSEGDLLFFGRKARGESKERVTHVGMYIGNGLYIHSSGKVKINSFNSKDENYSQYLVDIFLKAKRVINIQSGSTPIPVSLHPWYN